MRRFEENDVDWSKADGLWAQLNNREIAALVGVRYPDASGKRRSLVREAEANGTPITSFELPPTRRSDTDWSKADGLWAQFTNREISTRLGLTYARVGSQRNKLIRQAAAKGDPTTPFDSPPQNRTRVDLSKADGLWAKMGNRQLAEAIGVSPNTIMIARNRQIRHALMEGKSPKPYVYQKP
jgi:hypothetical protein